MNKCLQTDSIPAERRIGEAIRLPSEEEWEYATRGDRGLRYAWGKEPDRSKGNYHETGLNGTSAVGLFPPGLAFGGAVDLDDMSGNVWEWTSSRWGTSTSEPEFTYADWENSEEAIRIRNDLGPVEIRIPRGGSWLSSPFKVRCAVRNWNHPNFRFFDVGFRVVFSLAADS